MRKLEVFSLFAEKDVIHGGRAVGRRQDVARVRVSEQVDLLLLQKNICTRTIESVADIHK